MAYLAFHFGGGGVQNIFGKVGYLHGKTTRLLGGSGVYASPRKFLKIVQFGAF